MDGIPGFHCIVLDAAGLRSHPCLQSLQAMVNDAFRESEHKRFPTTACVIATLGTHGRCSVIFRDEDTALISPVATAMIKYYNPSAGLPSQTTSGEPSHGTPTHDPQPGYDTEPAHLLSIQDWEPAAVAVLPSDSTLQKLGLAIHSVAQLEQDLLSRWKQATKERALSDTGDGPYGFIHNTKLASLKFWIRAKESHAPYWERRGYRFVHSKVYPKGVWGSEKELRVVTLNKDIPILEI
ncbi:hypothetical protein LOZ66_001379 [Ophidiomyces ophidiicola]|nr:hypothetical protein LOZ66_001379 [Ophidiomyces ophidiicola]